MSPRIIQLPLSGGDRKGRAKGTRYAHGIHKRTFGNRLIGSAAEAKTREADRLECGNQLRAARALLDLDQSLLAEAAGIEFLNHGRPGVRLREK
jgi:hypothetical protein